MTRRIGDSRFEVAAGVIVMPICGPDERRDGWQVVVDGEYDNDFRLKRMAVEHAEAVAAARRVSEPVEHAETVDAASFAANLCR